MEKFALPTLSTLYKDLQCSERGLSSKEAVLRLKKFGFNAIQDGDEGSWYVIFIRQFINIMVAVLVIAMIVSFMVGERLDAYAILVIILMNAIIGFIQEYKAERAVEALKNMTAHYAFVLRDDEKKRIPARELVPGDIIILEEGMQIPADARLIRTAELQTIESSLTGESLGTEKSLEKPSKISSLGDLKNCVFMGTSVSRGRGEALVVQTGMRTEFGKLAGLVKKNKELPTPLQKQLSKLTKMMAIMVLCIALALFLLSLATGRDTLEMFILSISLAVSVIPEGLPAIITLTLALGVQKIAKKNAIMRKLSAAETLGSTSVICADKTGTLTQNRMEVQAIYINNEIVLADDSRLAEQASLEMFIAACALCNNTMLIREKKGWIVTGDPMEGALLAFADKAGFFPEKMLHKWPRVKEWVFTSERKRMTTQNGKFVFMKGAVDSILETCANLTPSQKRKILDENDAFARQAYRVLALAYKPIKNQSDVNENNMTFLGLVALMDPPRPEVKDAIAKCRSAHIRVVMITGDHALTAEAIGKEVGLFRDGDRILTGTELEKMSVTKLSGLVDKVSIYARVNPIHKVKILEALKLKGLIVAMTGDGVNDAPALKSADIGVAMGITGTDVSKEASDMILVDDNFATIVSTVEEGRIIYRNIKKFIRFLLAANFDEVLLVSVTFLLGFPLPFIPLQILWVNLLTDALPAIALGTDIGEKDIMQLKPRDPKKGIVTELVGFSIIAGVLSAAVSLVLFLTVVNDYSIERTRTLMFSTIVVMELFLVFSARFEEKHFFTAFFSNPLLLIGVLVSIMLQLFAVYHPFMQSILRTENLSGNDWIMMIGASVCAVLVLEFWKRFKSKPLHV